MTTCRILIAVCLTLLLTACGDEHKDKAPTPVVTPAAPASTPAPAPVPAPKPAAEQPREAEAAPAAAASVASPKAPAVEKATKPEAKAPAKPVAKAEPKEKEKVQKKPEVDPAVKQPLPHVQLDLRLPRDLVHQLQPDKPVPELDEKPLLPPMFGEKDDESPFQVGGRLIQRERNERETNDDSWHSDIRGAELQFQFRN